MRLLTHGDSQQLDNAFAATKSIPSLTRQMAMVATMSVLEIAQRFAVEREYCTGSVVSHTDPLT
jgi:hypothetical protein